MKLTVLNGSPKGEFSVTMQYVKYIQKKFPEHELKIINISERIKKIERNETYFNEIIDEIKNSDGLLWAFPLYVFLVASQYKRFIELITERNVQDAFKNKYTGVLTTSIHFYDHAAHNYMNAICDDLDMNYLGSYSADMIDLFEETERIKLSIFARNFFEDIRSHAITTKTYRPLVEREFNYKPSPTTIKVDNENKRVAVVTDSLDSDSNLSNMIEKFQNIFTDDISVYNLNDVDIKGGCLGCIQCGFDNVCMYQDKDGFFDFYEKLKDYDAIIFAGSMKDRYLSSKWKQFFDRGFYKGHTPSFEGKQMGFIISGSLNQNSNLREILEAYTQFQEANLVEIVTDEYGESDELDDHIQNFAREIIRSATSNYIKPSTFLGVAGTLIFRDAIFGRLRFPFIADHKYYKKHGLYNFPQKDYKIRVRNKMMILLTKLPGMKTEITKRTKKRNDQTLREHLNKKIFLIKKYKPPGL
jgi:multimeric flavodoxin WrbA